MYASDFETTTQQNLTVDGHVRVWLWSIVSLDLTEEYHGFDIESWYAKLVELKATCVWFHNLRFDGSFVLDWALRTNHKHTSLIDGLGNWFSVSLYEGKRVIELRDSAKKYPGQSVKSLAKLFAYPDKHECPNFDRYYPEGYIATDEEIEYCVQDSRIVARAMQKCYADGHKGLTLAGDAFRDVQSRMGGYVGFKFTFPLLKPIIDAFCRESYKGGWVYVNPKYQNIELDHVTVYDVNSLYPHVMYSCELPFGPPIEVDHIPKSDSYLYIIKISCSFKLKPRHFPTIQLKHDIRFLATEYLTHGEDVMLTLTSVDYKLFHDHYNVTDEKFIHGYMFRKKVGLLKDYIDFWMTEKAQAVKEHDASRKYIAKRYLNSPYGKFGSRPDKINKIAYLDDKGDVKFHEMEELGDGVYIPYASFVCAQARNITIRNAQKHYDDFVYADTDSIHLLGDNHDGLDVDSVRLGAWKCEGVFEKGKYLRAKTYIHADSQYNVEEIKCAGMPDEVKACCGWDDFYMGAIFSGKKTQKRVKGGVLIAETTFEIKEAIENVKRCAVES